ncbi:MAG TPA: DUF3597 domain-containing protein [Allosphingosinicella sp.]|jgi:hypothetical protein
MSVLGMITNAILGQGQAAQQAAQNAGAMPQMGTPQPGAQTQPVDVEAALTRIAESKGNPKLNWRTSIVDLMKLLDLDASLDNRKELATELGYAGAKDGSAEMNLSLHRKVMAELERNGGQVPAGMKD